MENTGSTVSHCVFLLTVESGRHFYQFIFHLNLLIFNSNAASFAQFPIKMFLFYLLIWKKCLRIRISSWMFFGAAVCFLMLFMVVFCHSDTCASSFCFYVKVLLWWMLSICEHFPFGFAVGHVWRGKLFTNLHLVFYRFFASF